MPLRKTPLVNGEYYHIFNRAINKQPVFTYTKDAKRAVDTIQYYKSSNPPLSFSKFLNQNLEIRKELARKMEQNISLVDIVSYCIMPNHFHFLLKQNIDAGIIQFVRKFEISYTKFFNIKYNRTGPLFQGRFKAVRIEDNDQLLHVSRYIHLNPLTSHVVRDFSELKEYSWSSLREYLSQKSGGICKKEIVLNQFSSYKKYEEFNLNQKDYQRRLEAIKHLVLDLN